MAEPNPPTDEEVLEHAKQQGTSAVDQHIEAALGYAEGRLSHWNQFAGIGGDQNMAAVAAAVSDAASVIAHSMAAFALIMRDRDG